MKLLQRKSKKKGFTLVELMVVIAIIAVLLLVAVPKMSDSTKGAKVRTFEANFRTLMSAANAAYADAGMDKSKVTAAVLQGTINSLKDRPAGATYGIKGATAAPGGSGTPAAGTPGVIQGTLPGSAIGLSASTGTGTGTGTGTSTSYILEFDVETGKLTVTSNGFENYATMKAID